MAEHTPTETSKSRGAELDTTVVVVGAGLSGLIAARELRRRDVDVLVVEAADRLGGRVMAETSALGSHLDLGGQWVGHDHHRVMALASELGLTPYRMHTGTLPTVVDGARRIPPVAPSMLVAILALGGLEVLTRTGTPRRWNTVSLDRWLRAVPGRTARRLLEVAASVSWTADLDRFSVHAMTEMIRDQGGLRTILSTRGGAQDTLLVEGAGALVEGLAAQLRPLIRTGTRVTSIVQDDHGVTVRTGGGDVRAAKVVVTVPPPMARQIGHVPPLPPRRVALERNTTMGSVYKAIAVYDRPFWRARRGGELLLLGRPGGAVFDTTSPGGPGHLCFLVAGPEARELDVLGTEGRRAALLFALAPHLGQDVLAPASWHEKSWHLDEYAGGGYIALPEIDTFEGLPPMPCEPVGHVHWAGAETAHEHAGYLEGAIASGERVAREVVSALG